MVSCTFSYNDQREAKCHQDPSLYSAWRKGGAKSLRLTLPFLQKVFQETYNSHSYSNLSTPVQLNNPSARAFTCGFNKTSNPNICHSRDSRKIQTQHDPLTTLCTQSQHWLFCSSSAQGYNQQAIFSTQYCRDVTSRCQGYLYCIHVFLTSVDK